MSDDLLHHSLVTTLKLEVWKSYTAVSEMESRLDSTTGYTSEAMGLPNRANRSDSVVVSIVSQTTEQSRGIDWLRLKTI